MKISIFFGTALGTRIFEHLYLSAGPLCGWPGYIDGYFCLCVYMHKPRRASLSDGYCLFVGGSMQPTDSAQSPVKGKVVR